MNWLKDFDLYCRAEGLNPDSSAVRRRFETGAGEVTVTDDRNLTIEDIDELTGGLIGNFNVPCPYCGPEKPWSTRLKIERPSLASARWKCFYCGRDGEVRGNGPIDRVAEAKARQRAAELDRERQEERRTQALRLWDECQPIKNGDPVRIYLEARGIYELPPNVDTVLRFHATCPFGSGVRRPCMLALMRDALTDEPRAIHRTWIGDAGHALGRMAMGPIARAAVKLWPLATDTLVVGEGVETVLAAATRVSWREPLQPAWSLTVANNMKRLPVIDGVKRLVILVDNDENGVGPRAANLCAHAWDRTGREVIFLTPNQTGADFNDVIRGAAT